MSVCEHSWTPYVNLPPGHEWGREDVFERCEKCGVAHTVKMVPATAPIYDDKGYFIEPTEVYFTKDMIPQNRRYLGSRLPPMLKIGLDQPHGNRRLLQIGPGVGQLVQGINDILSTADGERRNDDFALLHQGFPDQSAHLGVGAGLGDMHAPPVGALDLQNINILDRFGIAQDFVLATANIAGEKKSKGASVFPDIQDDLGGAKDMAGIAKGERHAINDVNRAAVIE